MVERDERLSAIPSVDRLLAAPGVARLLETHARSFVVERLRDACDGVRAALRRGDPVDADLAGEIERRLEAAIARDRIPNPRTIVNATGVVLHTNLGRALLPEEAIEAIARCARGAVALEFDVAGGRRGDRDDTIEDDLLALTGAEAATVVNNNAAAVLLVLNALAEGREVIVSRGELIEIGGSFRIPDVMAKSGARLREVGTTNRTHENDIRAAIGPDTAALLKVHTSNYRIVGFTAEVALEALVAIGRERGVAVIEDLGSGALVDFSPWGLPKEPVVRERIEKGADIVTFSGDKLLGGPQAGLIVGRRDAIERIKRNPLKRALRPGKLTLAALAAVLRLYRRAPDLTRALPTLRWLARPASEMRAVGEAAAARLREALGPGYEIRLEEAEAEIGSGALPTESLPSLALSVTHPDESPDRVARRFRESEPPIVGRIHDGRFLLDLRGIFDPAELIPAR